MAIPAIVLAGGRAAPELATVAGSEYRPLAAIGGRPMGAYVVAALQATPAIEEVVVVGPAPCRALGGDRFVESDAGMLENLFAGFAAGGYERALAIMADVPLVTPAALEAFVGEALATGAAFCTCAIPRDAYEAQTPQLRRTWVRLAEGEFTSGNLGVIERRALDGVRSVVAAAVAARKRPWRLVGLLGARALWRWWRGRLTLAEIEARASRLVQAPVRILITSHAVLGADVDRPEDLEAVRALLAATGGGVSAP